MKDNKGLVILFFVGVISMVIAVFPSLSPKPQEVKAEVPKGFPIMMHTTGYHCPRGSKFHQCDKKIEGKVQNDGLTATLTPVRKGVCAADWNVFPPGTKWYHERYGYCTVQDSGGKIKGRGLDFYYESNEEAIKHGVKDEVVFLVRWGPE